MTKNMKPEVEIVDVILCENYFKHGMRNKILKKYLISTKLIFKYLKFAEAQGREK
jgi:hypothetical protein